MTTDKVLEQNWKMLRGKVKQRWHSLTDADMRSINGNYETLLNMLQMKYFYSKTTAERDVKALLDEVATMSKSVHELGLSETSQS